MLMVEKWHCCYRLAGVHRLSVISHCCTPRTGTKTAALEKKESRNTIITVLWPAVLLPRFSRGQRVLSETAGNEGVGGGGDEVVEQKGSAWRGTEVFNSPFDLNEWMCVFKCCLHYFSLTWRIIQRTSLIYLFVYQVTMTVRQLILFN